MPEVRKIQIEDDTFTDDPHRAVELCELPKGVNIKWLCCATQDVAKEILMRMKKAVMMDLRVRQLTLGATKHIK